MGAWGRASGLSGGKGGGGGAGGAGGVGGTNGVTSGGAGSGATGGGGSGTSGGSAGATGNHIAQPGAKAPGGQQKGVTETNGMAGGSKAVQKEHRDHQDQMSRENAITDMMLDTGLDHDTCAAAYDAIFSYTDDSEEFHCSQDAATYMYGNRPDETAAADKVLTRMSPYKGEIFEGRRIDVDQFDEWAARMKNGDVFGFVGTYTGDEYAHSMDTWEPSLGSDVGVLASFTSDIDTASFFTDVYVDFHLDGTVTDANNAHGSVSSDKYAVVFRVIDNATAPSITHISASGKEEFEVLSPASQQFIFDHIEKGITPNGQKYAWVYMRDGGLKKKTSKYSK